MLFYSINKKSPKVNFEKALFNGLAPDGGLYFPENFPKFSNGEIKDLIGKSLPEVGAKIFQKWLVEEIDNQSLLNIAKKSLDFPIPLKKIDSCYILELFHGPTLAFKDVAAKCLSNLMDYFLEKERKHVTILVATSGDTGGAIAQGFSGSKNIKVVILYPKGKVSKLQEEQLTRVSDNISSIEIDGVFDDCQDLVKKAFIDPDLNKMNLTSANSINIGRLIPQIVYYAYAYSILPKPNLQFIIPSGNMGNITAGLFACKIGLPFKSFIIATNENDSAVKYYQTGAYKPQKTVSTISNAMDVGNPNNFIRVLEIFKHNYINFRKIIKAVKIDEKKAIKTIKTVYEKYDYLLDPHTAVGYTAFQDFGDSEFIPVLISTASPLKFAYEIKKATGINIDNQKLIKKLTQKKQKKFQMTNDYIEFKKFLLNLN